MGGNNTSKEDTQAKATKITPTETPNKVPIVEKQPTNIAEQLEKLKGYSLENRPGTKEYQLKCCKNKAINIVHNIQQIDSKYTLEESKQLDLTTLNKILKQIATYGEDLMKIILELDTIYTDDSEFKVCNLKKKL